MSASPEQPVHPRVDFAELIWRFWSAIWRRIFPNTPARSHESCGVANPKSFGRRPARIPKGALLIGPPARCDVPHSRHEPVAGLRVNIEGSCHLASLAVATRA
jgi:hypothetical protein